MSEASEWIKASEHLPEEDGDVIVCGVSEAGNTYVMSGYFVPPGYWYADDWPLLNVTHWQPFPAPPEELTWRDEAFR